MATKLPGEQAIALLWFPLWDMSGPYDLLDQKVLDGWYGQKQYLPHMCCDSGLTQETIPL